jgi:hypothetical protein
MELDPRKDDLFKALIEYRKDIQKQIKQSDKNNEQLDNLQNIIKIISNSTSYGIFVEINGIPQKNTKVKVYGNTSYTVVKDNIETFGKAFNPLVSTLITSASRLILAITERILTDNDSFYAFCDTDSMAIPPDMVRIIQEFFQPLNPYSSNEPLFKLEKENFNDNGELEPLYFYGISAKRYVLYNLKNGKPVIRKASSHGLGHITNPLTNDKSNKKWHEGIWLDILNLHYGFTTIENINEKYSQYYAISRLTISSMPIMKRFDMTNKGKPYHKQLIENQWYKVK